MFHSYKILAMLSAIIGFNEVIILLILLTFAAIGYIIYRFIIRRAGMKTSGSTYGNRVSAETDVLTQLERLEKLKERGALTDEEFENQKKKILSSSIYSK